MQTKIDRKRWKSKKGCTDKKEVRNTEEGRKEDKDREIPETFRRIWKRTLKTRMMERIRKKKRTEEQIRFRKYMYRQIEK